MDLTKIERKDRREIQKSLFFFGGVSAVVVVTAVAVVADATAFANTAAVVAAFDTIVVTFTINVFC